MIRTLLAAALVTLCTAARAGVEIRFSGEAVQESKSGFTVLGEPKEHVVAVSSARDHYSLILPWTEDWIFTLDDAPLLKGQSGLFNLTLSVEECDESPERHLRALQARLGQSGLLKGVEKSEIVTYKKEPVLRLVVDAEGASGRSEFRGVKLLHLHAVERVGRRCYVQHLSRVIPAEQAKSFDDKLLLSLVTVGFRADFMRGDRP